MLDEYRSKSLNWIVYMHSSIFPDMILVVRGKNENSFKFYVNIQYECKCQGLEDK